MKLKIDIREDQLPQDPTGLMQELERLWDVLTLPEQWLALMNGDGVNLYSLDGTLVGTAHREVSSGPI